MRKKERKEWLMYGLVGLLLLATMLVTLKGNMPKRYNLQAGDICPVDIYAPGVITDKLTTEKLKQDAREYVQKQYSFDLEASAQVEKTLKESLTKIKEFWGKYTSFDELSDSEVTASSVTREDWQAILAMSQSELERFSDNCTKAAEETMKNGMDAEHPDEAYAFLSESLNKKTFSQAGRRIAYNLVSSLLQPNKTYDPQATKTAKEEAAAKVVPVAYQKGEKIIGRGERIEEADYAMMKEMGYIREPDFTNLITYLGIGAVVVLLFLFCGFLLRDRYEEMKLRCNVMGAITAAFGIMLLILSFFIWQSDFNNNLIPVLIMAIVGAMICKEQSAFLLHGLVCAITALTMRGDLEYFLVSLLGGMVLIVLLRHVKSRTKIFLFCLPVALFEAALVISWEMMESNVLRDAVMNGVLMGVGVLLSGVIALGILPILESAFHLLTPFQLLEMTNSDHPLLKRLMTEAPGTYHHSLMVGNLAENAAWKVGADPLLTRVGAYYHDVGKLKHPIMFKENQLKENPHDEMTPEESAKLILQHPHDGVLIAQQYNMPKQLTDFILQHHGNTATMYFYQKAKELDHGAEIAEYRYAGPKPQSREMAIMMLADTVEAAVRTLEDDTPEAMERYVGKLVDCKLRDGQLSDSNLTLTDLEKIKESFVHTLKGFYHKRVAYQEMTDEN